MNRTIIGLDLAENYSQISYYNERSNQVETVSIQNGKDNFLIPTPKDMFKMAQEAKDLGIITLSNFIKTCLSFIRPKPAPEGICMMITMREVTRPWINALKEACEMLGIPRDQVVLQTYKESFECYILNQKRDVWAQNVVLFEYSEEKILSEILKIDRKTRPALVTIEEGAVARIGTQGALAEEEWNKRRDQLFLSQIKEVFADDKISACFLIGENFDKKWAEESIQYLCKKRHVFLGQNLYTKGACYGMCKRLRVLKTMDDFLFRSEDLVEVNLSMQLQIHGKESKYILINAGQNWYDASHTIEVLLDRDKKLSFAVKSMMGGNPEIYSITLTGLPDRPQRTTRIRIEAEYMDAHHCKVVVRDLGFGDLFPATNLVWTSTLSVG